MLAQHCLQDGFLTVQRRQRLRQGYTTYTMLSAPRFGRANALRQARAGNRGPAGAGRQSRAGRRRPAAIGLPGNGKASHPVRGTARVRAAGQP